MAIEEQLTLTVSVDK